MTAAQIDGGRKANQDRTQPTSKDIDLKTQILTRPEEILKPIPNLGITQLHVLGLEKIQIVLRDEFKLKFT